MKFEIEFCIKWNYHPEFDRVSKIIQSVTSDAEIIGNPKPPRTGAFEVKMDGNTVYSKFSTNTFPTKDDVIAWFPE